MLPPDNKNTSDSVKVKSTITSDIPLKKRFEVQLQGLFLTGLEDFAKDRGLSSASAFKEILEQRLIKEGYLPEWWLERKI
jgi:hypothetical protein